VLLTVGSKYDMPSLLSRAGKFLQANVMELNSNPNSKQFAWKWIPMAGKAGLPDVTQACIAVVLKEPLLLGTPAAACKKELLMGMLPATCCYLAEAWAQPVDRLAAVFCSNCNKSTRLVKPTAKSVEVQCKWCICSFYTCAR
jgi:hypothetical protein